MRAVFFDLDGTLCNTVGDIQYHINRVLLSHGYPPLDEERTKAFIGDGARRLVERALPPGAKDVEECFAEFIELFSASDGARTTLYEGETEALSALKGARYKLAVITNKPQSATRGCLAKFFPEDLFDFVGGDSGAFPVKPDPSLTRYAALTMRVSLRDCIFVGDGETDVQTAKNAGMRGISALWGYRTKEQLVRAGAREFAQSFSELVKIL